MKIRILLTGMCAAAILTASLAGCSVSVTTTETTKEPDQGSQTESSSKQEDATAAKDEYFYLSQGEVDSPEWFTKLDATKDCDQMIVVAGVGETTAYVTMHEKDENGKWKMILSTPGYTGLEGMGKADCNHAITPIGTFTIDKAFGLADDPGCQMEYTKCDDSYYWSADTREGMQFNRLVKIEDYPDLDVNASEHIADYVYEYQYCLNMGYNSEDIPENGCCFFFHCQGRVRPYTGGCVAINEPSMKYLMQRVKPDCKITIDKRENLGLNELPRV